MTNVKHVHERYAWSGATDLVYSAELEIDVEILFVESLKSRV